MPSKLPGSMTARRFDAAAKRAGLSPLLRARARRVLVDGEQPSEVAKSEGITTGTLYVALGEVGRYADSGERVWPMFAPPPPKVKNR